MPCNAYLQHITKSLRRRLLYKKLCLLHMLCNRKIAKRKQVVFYKNHVLVEWCSQSRGWSSGMVQVVSSFKDGRRVDAQQSRRAVQTTRAMVLQPMMLKADCWALQKVAKITTVSIGKQCSHMHSGHPCTSSQPKNTHHTIPSLPSIQDRLLLADYQRPLPCRCRPQNRLIYRIYRLGRPLYKKRFLGPGCSFFESTVQLCHSDVCPVQFMFVIFENLSAYSPLFFHCLASKHQPSRSSQ